MSDDLSGDLYALWIVGNQWFVFLFAISDGMKPSILAVIMDADADGLTIDEC